MAGQVEMPTLSIEAAFTTGADLGTLLQLDDPTRGRLDTGTLAAGAEEPVWSDLTDRFTEGQATISRGSQRVDAPLVVYEHGNASIPLANNDRALDPSNLDGPYTRVTGELDGTEVVLNSNTTFETAGPTGWAGFGGTLTRASDQVFSGSFSGKFVPSGVDGTPFVASDWATLTAGDTYRISARLRCAVDRTVYLSVHWYDSTPTLISISTSDAIGLPAGVWTPVTFTAIAPTGATQGPMLITMVGTPPAGDILWMDEVEYANLPYLRATQVTAMRAARVRATWDGITYELFRGTADDWDVDWRGPAHAVTTLTATDGFKILSGIDRAAVAEVGAGETTSARVTRILDSAGWPTVDRSIGTGISTLQGTTLEGDTLSELQSAAASEQGELYIDGGGRVVFRGRHATLTESRSATSQATFGDDVGELPYVTLGLASDDGTFFNHIRVTRRSTGEGDDPVEQVAEDTVSQALFYKKTHVAGEVLLQTDADAADYARALLHVAGEPELRFTQITIEPAQQPDDLWPHALGRQIGDRITIRRRPPGGGEPIERDCFIRGILHEFGGEEWTTTWALQDAGRYGSFMVLDHPTLGRLDSGNALAF